MAPSQVFFAEEQGAKTNINAHVGLYDQAVTVAHTPRYIIAHVTAVQ